MTAKKFSFTPNELRIKTGQPVTLTLTAEDFVHGFSVPDFNVRIDMIPGKTVELTFTPNRAGTFVFLCDNFCGEGHDKMSGASSALSGTVLEGDLRHKVFAR